ncbi:DEAD/DEAH box helicase [Leptospira bouyouniensis]|uniref:DEAD-box ATP-dependent RNA helicase RhpA n=1 Tax=Leptospira bouyouniensis TaxID=2484911 RepID=A0A7I0HSI8_9LEPT|nr:DEAD/DEAH box helicase [Leptospira bouyouniensis]TGL06703.1 DEAD/DEAH box helicase [Leptospira bouyouniensis]
MQKQIETFSDLKLDRSIQKAVVETGYTKPTPIQIQAIPLLLDNHDLLGCAQTGTGKTAAFALPMIHNLISTRAKPNPKQPRSLVLVPTRELAIQVHESFVLYGKYTQIRTAVIFGGVGQNPQAKAIASGLDVLIATPGRLVDLMNQNLVSLKNLEIFVLDEADRMLDMGFIHDIRKIISYLPKRRQNLFFSATMPSEIEKLANSILVEPIRIDITPVSSTVELISQSVMYTELADKKNLLLHLFKDKNFKKTIIFTKTKHGANKISELLNKSGIKTDVIHGNKSQSARQRALEDFRSGKNRALVATDLAARGIDIDDITHVINYEIPYVPETYVHRIGRTARAGKNGIAIAIAEADERSLIKDIEKVIGISIPVDRDHPYHAARVESYTGKAPKIHGSGGGGNRGQRRPSQSGDNSSGRNANSKQNSKQNSHRSQGQSEKRKPSDSGNRSEPKKSSPGAKKSPSAKKARFR